MLIDISPLRVSRDYRLLFFGQLVSAFGTAMSFVVLPVQVYQLSGSTLLGPSIAGIILARYGASIAYSIDLVTFAASLTAVFLIRAVPAPSQIEERPTLKSVAEGLNYAWKRKDILGTYLIDMNAMFFGMPAALFPAMAANFGAGTVGFFYAAPSVGAVVATLTSGWAKKINRHGVFVADDA